MYFRTRLALVTILYTIYWSFSVIFCLYLFWYIYVTTFCHDSFWFTARLVILVAVVQRTLLLFKKKIFTIKENIQVNDCMKEYYFHGCDKETVFIFFCLYVTHNPTRNKITFLYLYKLCVFIFLLRFFRQYHFVWYM